MVVFVVVVARGTIKRLLVTWLYRADYWKWGQVIFGKPYDHQIFALSFTLSFDQINDESHILLSLAISV